MTAGDRRSARQASSSARRTAAVEAPRPGSAGEPGLEAAPAPGAYALRVAVVGTARLESDRPIVVAPGDRPGSPGSGGASPPPLVDGMPVAVHLERRDAQRAVLVEGDGREARRTRVLLGPLRAADPDGRLRRELVVDGWRVEVEIEHEQRAALRERARRIGAAAGHGGPIEVRAMIPGRIVVVGVGQGDTIEAGQRLLVIEAMKMQNELRAPRAGTVDRVAAEAGATVELGDLLLVIR